MSEGVLAAAGTIAAGAAILYGTGAFEKDDDACKGVQENLKASLEKAQSSNKLTDASAAARAAAMAEYACKYYSAVKVNARNNMIIALIQQAASFYFADKQHDVAKQAQNRFDEIWSNQKDKSDKFFNHWYDNSRPIELRMLSEASEREKRGYQVDYETAKDRAIATAFKKNVNINVKANTVRKCTNGIVCFKGVLQTALIHFAPLNKRQQRQVPSTRMKAGRNRWQVYPTLAVILAQ